MIILTREEMYAYDNYTIEKLGIPGKKLMENAGKGCSDFLKEHILDPENKITIFCGNGNNGGDGFVIARYLHHWNFDVNIYLIGDPVKMSPETRENYEDCLKLNIKIEKLNSENELETAKFNESDIIIDAIFGVGLKGSIQGWRANLIRIINDCPGKTISIDIPSGLDANLGKTGIAVRADHTLTMAALKYCLVLESGREFCGETRLIDIGIPLEIAKIIPVKAGMVTSENVNYPYRNRLYHKGNYGRIAVIAGSPGYSGAAILACRAALRAGGGLITLFHLPGMEQIFENQLLEVMTSIIPFKKSGEIDFAQMDKKISGMDVLLIGPGLGLSDNSRKLVEYFLKNWNKPLVLDADAINTIAENRELLEFLPGKLILPHLGEFSRLTEIDIENIKKDPITALKAFSSRYNTHILLKSATSIYCDNNNLIFDISGNDGLATGGSGDVLAGIIVSFLGQKLDYKDAAVSASYMLGIATEKLAEFRGIPSIIPSDIVESLFMNWKI